MVLLSSSGMSVVGCGVALGVKDGVDADRGAEEDEGCLDSRLEEDVILFGSGCEGVSGGRGEDCRKGVVPCGSV